LKRFLLLRAANCFDSEDTMAATVEIATSLLSRSNFNEEKKLEKYISLTIAGNQHACKSDTKTINQLYNGACLQFLDTKSKELKSHSPDNACIVFRIMGRV